MKRHIIVLTILIILSGLSLAAKKKNTNKKNIYCLTVNENKELKKLLKNDDNNSIKKQIKLVKQILKRNNEPKKEPKKPKKEPKNPKKSLSGALGLGRTKRAQSINRPSWCSSRYAQATE